MRTPLNDRAIRAMKATDQRIEMTDAACRGLAVRCTPAGTKTFAYTYKTGGRTQRVTLGTYPDMTLQQARAQADIRRAQKNCGDNPRSMVATERVEQARAGLTFDAAADLYMVDAKKRKTSWKNDEGYLKRPRAHFGSRILSGITKTEVREFLETIRSPSSANRTQSILRTLWGWAFETDRLPANMLAGMKKVGGKEQPKDRVLTAVELKVLFKVLDAGVPSALPTALALILFTAQRPGEVAGMMQSELHDMGGDSPLWIIPAARTKNKISEHAVPLSQSAVRLIEAALQAGEALVDPAASPNDRAVFASRFATVATLARHSLSRYVRRMVGDDVAPFTPHDLRRTAATLAQAGGIHREHVGALLNHADGSVTSVYARHNMLAEKRAAVTAIEDQVLKARK